MNPSHADISTFAAYLDDLQQRITTALTATDGSPFRRDAWQRDEPRLRGHGLTMVLQDGAVFEQGGVNVSHIAGEKLPAAATEKRPKLADCAYTAHGLSLVIHPRNPYVPTSHANIRLFTAHDGERVRAWWFGGGIDLTPYYPFDDDCRAWHRTAHDACAPFGADLYPRYKAWCDRYFYLPHRGETRGIGGLFYDDYQPADFAAGAAFTRAVGESWLAAYLPIVEKRKGTAYGEGERAFQLYRRGRYVEFNLLYDRGTHFGLQSGGRTESILMSLPPLVRFTYDYQPAAGSAEARLADYLKPREWL